MMNVPPVLYRGSVKNVRGEVSNDFLFFEFSDRFSVFDWGEMPDLLGDKGKTLAIMGKSFFKHLENPQNWKGLFTKKALTENFSNDYLKALSESSLYKKYCLEGMPHHADLLLKESWDSAFLKVKNVAVARPPFEGSTYNYDFYKTKPINSLVPLEVIFRLGLSSGNSLSKRLGNDLAQWQSFGFDKIPDIGMLQTPVIDFSTKLERGDRYISYNEAREISGMSADEWNELLQMTHLIALNLFNFHHELGLELWDGKIEVAFTSGMGNQRSFMLVDSIGIDELRLLYKGKSFSKEFLREFYKDSPWYKNLEAAKKDVLQSGGDFKKVCTEKYHSTPSPLDRETKARAEAVYKSYANEVSKKITGERFFSEEFNLENYNKRFL